MSLLDLDPDELLSTTRAVRKRLDLSRPVPDDLIRECVSMALQAPSGGNEITMRFVVVRDRAAIEAIAAVYAQCWQMYTQSPTFVGVVIASTDVRELRRTLGRPVEGVRIGVLATVGFGGLSLSSTVPVLRPSATGSITTFGSRP